MNELALTTRGVRSHRDASLRRSSRRLTWVLLLDLVGTVAYAWTVDVLARGGATGTALGWVALSTWVLCAVGVSAAVRRWSTVRSDLVGVVLTSAGLILLCLATLPKVGRPDAADRTSALVLLVGGGVVSLGLLTLLAVRLRLRTPAPDETRAPRAEGPPRISVVIPALDDAELLDRCLLALSRQTLPAHEVIVVDNGSRDATAEVAARWGARVVVQAERGIPAAASLGYDVADGDVIARLDADSVPGPDWLHRLESAFAGDPALDAVSGPGTFDDLGPIGSRAADLLYMRAYFVLMGATLGHPPLFGSNLAMRTGIWRSARGGVATHDAELHDDLDLSAQLPFGARVRVDAALRMPVSARPFTSLRAMVTRVIRGVRTLRRSPRVYG